MTQPIKRILAGPGSGKTTLLIQEIRRRLESGADPTTIIGVTFTRKAAQEMRDRLTRPRPAAPSLPWMGTFHQLARRIQLELKCLRQPINLDALIPDAIHAIRGNRAPEWITRLTFLAVDEVQDLDQTQIDFLLELRAHAPQSDLLLVGDPDQCLPPGTPIATPNGWQPIEALRSGNTVLGTAGTTQLLGGQITSVCNRHWTGPLWVVQAGEQILRGTPHHLIPVRRNPPYGLYYVYLMYRAERGYRIGLTKSLRSGDERHQEPGFRVRLTQEHGDRLWILQTCSSYVEARYYETLYATKYGLPTLCFHGQGRNLSLDDKWIKKLYQTLDTTSQAQRLMADLWIDPNFPHHPAQNSGSRQSVTLTMFGNRTPSGHRHAITWSSIQSNTIERLQTSGYPLSFKGGRYASLNIQRSSYNDALNIAKNIAKCGHLSLRRRIRVGKSLYDLMPLSHLHPGMNVLIQEDNHLVEAQIDNVSQETYDGPVYDLEVDTLHTYTASHWLVHNSIYGFRNASPHFLLRPESYLRQDCTTIVLGRNHRSARAIVAAARAILSPAADPQAPCHSLVANRSEDHPAVRQLIAQSPTEEAEKIFNEIRTLLAIGVPIQDQAILVRTRAQMSALRGEAARWNIPLYTPPLEDRDDPPHLELSLQEPTAAHGLTLVTIHQAKGCEWTVVYLAGCQEGLIPHPMARTRAERDEERRLLYVAVTRAKQLLWLCRHGRPSPYLTALHHAPGSSTSSTDTEPSFWYRLASLFSGS